MKLLFHDNWIDLEAPVYMSEGQRFILINFFKDNYEDVEVEEVQEAGRNIGARESIIKEWTENDLLILLSSSDNETIAKQMNRTIMSVKMKRGYFVPDFWKWMRDRGITPPADIELIRKYVNEVLGK
ncbi:MAG: hypothetical protein QCI82_10125 [Candidatus Thermoplasmatota archaeon]|nr:hypothetical protein [Candidatus Thermoplasmatota archaeon]